jgi:non-specific serine/threonine protein kinase
MLADNLLRSCLNLRILTTSREPLGVGGEANYLVPSLPFPDPRHLPALEELARNTAVSLFVDRARSVVPDYAVTPRNAADLARICERLDGIPLALELAAARVNLLTTEQLAARLDDVFVLLTSGSRIALPRHQTLRATIDWSYNLLGEAERLLLQRMSVFAGGCTLEAAEDVCSGEGIPPGQVLEQLALLVQKSMVVTRRGSDNEPRYRLLEMVRQYAAEKLAGAGDQARMGRRHWEYFLRMAEANAGRLSSKARSHAFDRFQADLENLRLALAWAFNQPTDPEAGLKLLVALQPLWFVWDRRETMRWLPQALALIRSGHPIAPALQARFLAWASAASWCTQGARSLAEQSLAIARTLGPEEAEILCWSLWMLAIGLDGCYMEIQAEHWDQAEALLDEQEALFPALGPSTRLDPRLYLAYNRWVRAMLANYRGHYQRAEAYARESLRLMQTDFSGLHSVGAYITLGDSALLSGAFDQAIEYYEQADLLVVLPGDFSYMDVRNGDVSVLLCEAHLRRGSFAQALAYCRVYLSSGGPPYTLERLEMAARIFARAGRYPEAARLSAGAQAESERLGRPASSRRGSDYYWGDWRTRYADVALEALVPGWPNRPDADAIQQAWDEGRAMTYQQVLHYALYELSI